MKHLVPIAAAALLLLIILAAAMPLYHWFDEEETTDEFGPQLDLWRSHGIDSYEFLIRKNCDCGPPGNIPVRVIVRDSLAIAAYDERKPFDPTADRIDGLPTTIAQIFDLVRRGGDGQAMLIAVQYDEQFGFPYYLQLDPDATVAGDEFDYTVGMFKVTAATR